MNLVMIPLVEFYQEVGNVIAGQDIWIFRFGTEKLGNVISGWDIWVFRFGTEKLGNVIASWDSWAIRDFVPSSWVMPSQVGIFGY